MDSAARAFCSTRRIVVPLSRSRGDDGEDLPDDQRRQADGRLVQHEQARARHERPCPGRASAARRRRACRRAGRVFSSGWGRAGRSSSISAAAAPVPRAPPPQVPAEQEVFVDGEVREDLPSLGHQHAAGRQRPISARLRAMSRLTRSFTAPSVGRTTPAIALRSVLLPAPFAPTMVTISPASTCRETPCRTSTLAVAGVHAPEPKHRRPPGTRR